METAVYEESHNDHSIKIYHDPDAENPRDWCNLGTLICRHPRYSLGDKHGFADAREFLLDLLELDDECVFDVDQLLERAARSAIILPVYLYDHSGLVMNTTGFHCHPHGYWDSGQIGFVYVSLDDVRKEYSVSRVSANLRSKVSDCLKSEVAVYSDYIGGNVYGYVVEKDGEETSSCWGYVGDYDGYCLEEARSTCT